MKRIVHVLTAMKEYFRACLCGVGGGGGVV